MSMTSEKRGSAIQSQSRSKQTVSQPYNQSVKSITPSSQSSFTNGEDRKQENSDRIKFNEGTQTFLAEFKLVKPDLNSVLGYVESRFNVKFCDQDTKQQECNANTALHEADNDMMSGADHSSARDTLQKNTLRTRQKTPNRYLTHEEKQQLNNFWVKCRYPTPKDYDNLSHLTNIPKSTVKRFFQRRRREYRKMRKALLLD